MRLLRLALCFAVCAIGFVNSALFGQDLARLAIGERARRESNEREGRPVTGFTNVGVRTRAAPVSGTCLCVLDSSPTPSFGRDSWRRLQDETRARELAWERIRYAHTANFHRAKTKLGQLKRLERACAADGVSVVWTAPCGTTLASPSWGVGASVCAALPDAIRVTEEDLTRIRSGAYEDARKLRIPTGHARLE